MNRKRYTILHIQAYKIYALKNNPLNFGMIANYRVSRMIPDFYMLFMEIKKGVQIALLLVTATGFKPVTG